MWSCATIQFVPKLIEQYVHPKHPRLYLQHRSDSKFLQAITFLSGRTRQRSMKTAHLPTALRLAEDWYSRELRTDAGEVVKTSRSLLDAPILEEVFKAWLHDGMAAKKRGWCEMKWSPMARFWEAMRVTDVTTRTFKDFYRWRRTKPTRKGTQISNHTLHKDVIFLRQLLKYAMEEEHIDRLPAIPKVGSIEPNPRPWLTPQEWKHLEKVSAKRILEAKGNPRLQRQRQELDNQMVWMVFTMTRVFEMLALRFRDCRITKNTNGDEILICEVKGKRGIRTIVGRAPALNIFKDYQRKGWRDSNDLMFPVHHHEALTELLIAADLHIDPLSGFERNFKAFRCTAISFAILQGTDLLWIARNAGTSVAMIDQFYARRLSAEMAQDELTKAWKD